MIANHAVSSPPTFHHRRKVASGFIPAWFDISDALENYSFVTDSGILCCEHLKIVKLSLECNQFFEW